MARRGIRLSHVFWGLLLIVSLSIAPTGQCQGYIMPARQIIGLMAANFSKFKTVVITQSTQQEDQRGEKWEESFVEKIWMKSPNLYRSQVLYRGVGRITEPDNSYRQLMIANSSYRLATLLSRMGITLHSVSLTRTDGTVAYMIGDDEPESPKLFIEKERFLPLLIIYRTPSYSHGKTIMVQFKDYRKLDQGWYPYEITYADGGELVERYVIHTLQANVILDPTLFTTPHKESGPDYKPGQGEETLEEERVREMIKRFEERYQ